MRFNRTTITAGVFAGAASALWTLFEYIMGWHGEKLETGAVTGFVAVVFPLAAILWALRMTKQENGGTLTLRQALTCGLAVSSIIAAIGVVFFYAYYTHINPQFIVTMGERGHRVDVITQIITVAVSSVLFGLVVSAVAGFFMRSKTR